MVLSLFFKPFTNTLRKDITTHTERTRETFTRTMSSARKSDTTRLTPTLASSFPFSTAQPSAIFHFPGGSAASGEMVRRVLTENDHKYDIYESARCEWDVSAYFDIDCLAALRLTRQTHTTTFHIRS